MRNNGVPDITVMPSRTINSTTTPPIGAASVMRGWVRSVRLDQRDLCLAHAGLQHALARTVDERQRDLPPCMRRTARNSSCAAIQSGK